MLLFDIFKSNLVSNDGMISLRPDFNILMTSYKHFRWGSFQNKFFILSADKWRIFHRFFFVKIRNCSEMMNFALGSESNWINCFVWCIMQPRKLVWSFIFNHLHDWNNFFVDYCLRWWLDLHPSSLWDLNMFKVVD